MRFDRNSPLAALPNSTEITSSGPNGNSRRLFPNTGVKEGICWSEVWARQGVARHNEKAKAWVQLYFLIAQGHMAFAHINVGELSVNPRKGEPKELPTLG